MTFPFFINFVQFCSIFDFQNHIANFNANYNEIDGAKVFYLTKQNLATWHVPLADNTTEFGEKFNRAQLNFIRCKISITRRSDEVGFWEHMQQCLSETLKGLSPEL